MADNAAPESSGWKKFFTERLPIDQRGLIGTVVFFIIILIMGWVGVNEPARMTAFDTQYEARSMMRGAALYRTNCSGCHGLNGEGLPGVAPGINNAAFFNGQRLAEVGWAGTLEDYVELTVAAGRPVMSQPWPQPMPTWGQEYGGPLRPDEVQDVVAFVLNWGLQYEEGAEPIVEAGPMPTPEEPAFEPVGTDLAVALPEGDAARGESLFLGTQPGPDGAILACQGCHSIDGTPMTGPSMLGLVTRIPDGYDSPEQYIHESIVLPCNYVVEGYQCIMPQNYGERLDAQSLADVLAYLLTFSE